MKYEKILSIKKVEENTDYYDIHVPEYNNYLAHGLFHHNSGKDHTSAKILAYVAYWLLCFKDVRQFFPGIGYNTPICFGNTSISGIEAKNIFFNDFKSILQNVRNPNTGGLWFEEHGVDLREGRDIQTREIKFPQRIYAYSLDSKKFTGIGKNLLVQIYDEIGAFPPKDAEELHSETRKTQRSRFPHTWKSVLISYKHSDYDYMNMTYEKSKNKKKVWRDKAATWEVNLARTKDDFADEYLTDPEGAKRTYECKGGVIGTDTYIKFPGAIINTIDFRRKNPIVGNKSRVWGFRDMVLHKWFEGTKGINYHIHIDLAKGLQKGDCVGFAMAHMIKGYPIQYDINLCDHLSKEGFNVKKIQDKVGNAVFVDLMFQMRAEREKEIQFSDFIRFVMYLKKIRGFNITLATFDGWQSVSTIQELNNKGIKAELLSVDRDTVAYDTYKGLIYKGLFNTYLNLIYIREAKELIRTKNNKIDHPEKSLQRSMQEHIEEGSKDIGDCVTSVCKSLSEHRNEFNYWFSDFQTDKLIKTPSDYENDYYKEIQRRGIENVEELNEMAENEDGVRKGKTFESKQLVKRGEIPEDFLDY